MSLLLAWTTLLPAQTTREKADKIVLDFLKSEGILSGLLYVNDIAPGGGLITLTTSKAEIIKPKYACWVYYLNENGSDWRRYFFVKNDNESLLEVIAHKDTGPADLAPWKAVDMNSGIKEMKINAKLLYSNPVKDFLTFSCKGESVRVEIYDLKGSCLFTGSLSDKDTCQLNVSFLSTGIYVVSVDGERYKIIKN